MKRVIKMYDFGKTEQINIRLTQEDLDVFRKAVRIGKHKTLSDMFRNLAQKETTRLNIKSVKKICAKCLAPKLSCQFYCKVCGGREWIEK